MSLNRIPLLAGALLLSACSLKPDLTPQGGRWRPERSRQLGTDRKSGAAECLTCQ